MFYISSRMLRSYITSGIIRYFSIQRALAKGLFPVARIGVTGITLIMGVIIVVVFAILTAERN